jgi:YfiR/HmsC-like
MAVTTAAQAVSTEYQRKAAFLVQFPNFVEWPIDASQTAQTSFQICVYGDFGFGTSLAESTRGTTVHGRKLELRWVRKLSEIRTCQILFVSRSEHARYGQVLAAAANSGVLTVGETAGFLEAGGAICFSYDRELLQFEVNLTAARDARLKMSAQLLGLAKRVMNPAEGAKG